MNYIVIGMLISFFCLAELPDRDIRPFYAAVSGTAGPAKSSNFPAYDAVAHTQLQAYRTKKKTTSVIVPCHYAHAKHLYPLLRSLEEQTVLPDEVVISLSEYAKVPEGILAVLVESRWAFPITVIASEKKLYSAQNRNVASAMAKGDVFIYNDADDQPHPQRIEIIKFFFESYDLDMLMHKFVQIDEQTQVQYATYNELDYVCPSDYSYILGRDIHNGNNAIARHVFEAFKWPDFRSHEDEFYNRILYKYFGNRMIVLAPLIMYRNYLSCGYQQNLLAVNAYASVDTSKNEHKQHAIHIVHNTVLYQD